MLSLLAYALIPVVLGAAVAFVPGADRRFFRPLHTLAFAAALVVVLGELLPGAVAGAGPLALVPFALGLAAPALIDRALGSAGPDDDRDHDHGDGMGLELAFGGFLLHQVVDGLSIGASGAIEDGMTVVLAVAAHTTPVVAVTVLAYAHHDGRRTALRRAIALALATALGVVVGYSASTAWLAPVEPWLRAVIAGTVLYILGHDLADDRPETPAGRTIEALATVAGMAVPLAWMTSHQHHHGAEHPGLTVGVGVVLGLALVVQGLWLAGWIDRRNPLSGGH